MAKAKVKAKDASEQEQEVVVSGASKIDKVLSAINKKAGKAIVNRLGNVPDQYKITFLPTPSLKLNIALGGGIARGKIAEFAGEQSSGKTSMALEIIALDQRINPKAIWGWYETEESFDWDYAVGVQKIDPTRLILWDVTDQGAEKGLDVMDALIRTGELSGVVVNSVTGLTPKKEFEGEMADQNVGLQARMMSKLMRKIVGICSKNKVAAIFINQFREKVGVLHGDPRTTTGGRALAFFASQRIDFNKVKIEAADGWDEEDALKISYRVRKNRFKHKNPWRKGSYIAVFGEGIDTISEIADLAPELGICQKGGSWIYYPEKSNIATLEGVEMKFQSAAKFMDFLTDHPASMEFFYNEVMKNLDKAEIGSESMTPEEIDGVKQEEADAEEFIRENADATDLLEEVS